MVSLYRVLDETKPVAEVAAAQCTMNRIYLAAGHRYSTRRDPGWGPWPVGPRHVSRPGDLPFERPFPTVQQDGHVGSNRYGACRRAFA
jgi:hypothetical protein